MQMSYNCLSSLCELVPRFIMHRICKLLSAFLPFQKADLKFQERYILAGLHIANINLEIGVKHKHQLITSIIE